MEVSRENMESIRNEKIEKEKADTKKVLPSTFSESAPETEPDTSLRKSDSDEDDSFVVLDEEPSPNKPGTSSLASVDIQQESIVTVRTYCTYTYTYIHYNFTLHYLNITLKQYKTIFSYRSTQW